MSVINFNGSTQEGTLSSVNPCSLNFFNDRHLTQQLPRSQKMAVVLESARVEKGQMPLARDQKRISWIIGISVEGNRPSPSKDGYLNMYIYIYICVWQIDRVRIFDNNLERNVENIGNYRYILIRYTFDRFNNDDHLNLIEVCRARMN